MRWKGRRRRYACNLELYSDEGLEVEAQVWMELVLTLSLVPSRSLIAKIDRGLLSSSEAPPCEVEGGACADGTKGK